MREIRQSGSEGGGTKSNRLSLPLLRALRVNGNELFAEFSHNRETF